jgi:hypothetical protein
VLILSAVSIVSSSVPGAVGHPGVIEEIAWEEPIPGLEGWPSAGATVVVVRMDTSLMWASPAVIAGPFAHVICDLSDVESAGHTTHEGAEG